MKTLIIFFASVSMALASGTITPGGRPGSNRCATSSMDGRILDVDAENGQVSLDSKKHGKKTFKVSENTVYRIPGATKEEIKNGPMLKIMPQAEAKIIYCRQDESVVEIKVKK
ncbi:MAG: hypothetical protein WD696_18790 [Bryobacteraceae bacterium]